MKKTLVVTLAMILVLGSVILLFHKRPPSADTPLSKTSATPPGKRTEAERRARSAQLNAEASRALRFDQRNAKLQNDPLDRSGLSESAILLDDPKISTGAAMEALHSLLASLRTTANKGEYPAGMNVEVTNALLGDNPLKIGTLPMDSPRINENGELTDSYGTPLFFHSLTGKDMTITSAGPDRLLHTADDLVYPAN